jgi:hypothetical protein
MPPVNRYGSSCSSCQNVLPLDCTSQILLGRRRPAMKSPAGARSRTSGSTCRYRLRRHSSGSTPSRGPGRHSPATTRDGAGCIHTSSLDWPVGSPRPRGLSEKPGGPRWPHTGPVPARPPRAARARPRHSASNSWLIRAGTSRLGSTEHRTRCNPVDRRKTGTQSRNGIASPLTASLNQNGQGTGQEAIQRSKQL